MLIKKFRSGDIVMTPSCRNYMRVVKYFKNDLSNAEEGFEVSVMWKENGKVRTDRFKESMLQRLL